jgi:hypothetical protein
MSQPYEAVERRGRRVRRGVAAGDERHDHAPHADHQTEKQALQEQDLPQIMHLVVVRSENAVRGGQHRAQLWYHAATVDPTGMARPTTICNDDGGAVPVRRGIAVNRNPMAKQVMNPWIWAMAWKIGQ